jgi:hypothetical protein
MTHPFASIVGIPMRVLLFVSSTATLVTTAVLIIVDRPLVTPEAPFGIVSFELAGNSSNVQAILGSWSQQASQNAAFSLGFDYLYMLAYSTLLGAGCVLAAKAIRSASWPFWGLGIPLAWGMWLAAVFDAVENVCLSLILLAGATSNLWPGVARTCALSKFGLLFIGLVFVFYGLAVGMVGWLKR